MPNASTCFWLVAGTRRMRDRRLLFMDRVLRSSSVLHRQSDRKRSSTPHQGPRCRSPSRTAGRRPSGKPSCRILWTDPGPPEGHRVRSLIHGNVQPLASRGRTQSSPAGSRGPGSEARQTFVRVAGLVQRLVRPGLPFLNAFTDGSRDRSRSSPTPLGFRSRQRQKRDSAEVCSGMSAASLLSAFPLGCVQDTVQSSTPPSCQDTMPVHADSDTSWRPNTKLTSRLTRARQ